MPVLLTLIIVYFCRVYVHVTIVLTSQLIYTFQCSVAYIFYPATFDNILVSISP